MKDQIIKNPRRGREEFLTVEVVLLVGGGVEVDDVVEDVTEIYPQG